MVLHTGMQGHQGQDAALPLPNTPSIFQVHHQTRLGWACQSPSPRQTPGGNPWAPCSQRAYSWGLSPASHRTRRPGDAADWPMATGSSQGGSGGSAPESLTRAPGSQGPPALGAALHLRDSPVLSMRQTTHVAAGSRLFAAQPALALHPKPAAGDLAPDSAS